MQCVTTTSALRATTCVRAAAGQGLRLAARPAIKVWGAPAARSRHDYVSGICQFAAGGQIAPPRSPCPRLLQPVGLKATALVGLRLEQHVAAPKAQRRTAVIAAAAEAELDPLERCDGSRGASPCVGGGIAQLK